MAPEQASVLVAPEANLASNLASTKIATLGGPPVTIEQPAPAAPANTDKADAKKRQQAQRTKARRRMAQRARLTAQLPQHPPTRSRNRRHRSQPLNLRQAGPVATGGPSGKPHSDHEPS